MKRTEGWTRRGTRAGREHEKGLKEELALFMARRYNRTLISYTDVVKPQALF